jgi:hypothetical protein
MTETTGPDDADRAAHIARLEASPVGELTIADCLTLAIHRLAQGVGVEPLISAAADPVRIHSRGWPQPGAAMQPPLSGRTRLNINAPQAGAIPPT